MESHEHRVFPHVTHALQGAIFKSHELVKELIETTTTKNGLTVKATIIDKLDVQVFKFFAF